MVTYTSNTTISIITNNLSLLCNQSDKLETGWRGFVVPRHLCVCACVCACVMSEQLNQENGKSYGTGFFGKVQR